MTTRSGVWNAAFSVKRQDAVGHRQPPTTPAFHSGQAAKKARTARKIAPNPFGDRGCITNPKRFFDRESLLRQILENLHKGSSVALIGEFRIGKIIYSLDASTCWVKGAQAARGSILVSGYAADS